MVDKLSTVTIVVDNPGKRSTLAVDNLSTPLLLALKMKQFIPITFIVIPHPIHLISLLIHYTTALGQGI